MCLNDLAEKDTYSIPNMKNIINATAGAKHITILDLKEGYYQIEIEEAHKHKTAFEFEHKVYEWNGMVMGYKNAPMIFQRIMNKIMSEYIGKGVEIYLDDIVIHSSSIEEHDRLVRNVFMRLKENNLKVNLKKIQFSQQEAKLLGVTINGKDKVPLEIKRNETLDFPRPKCDAELKRFLGLMGWFREFIKDFAVIAGPLYEALKRKKEFEWTEDMENSYCTLKVSLQKASSLKLPEYEKIFTLKTDASNTGIGAVLMQQNNEGLLVPIQWASKKLTQTETRYSISEKEMLAIMWAIKKFDYELRGRKFHLITDHKALASIREKPEFNNNRINRWIEAIQSYDFTIEYKTGEELVDADYLSRLYEKNSQNNKEKKHIITEKGKKIQEGKIKKHIVIVEGKKFWKFDSGIMREIPKEKDRDDIVKEAHERLIHRGIEAVYYELKQQVYWPRMKADIYNVLKNCRICKENNFKKKGGSIFVTTSRPLEKFAVDVLKLDSSDEYVLVCIDYFSRYCKAAVIGNRREENIIAELLKIFNEIGVPEQLVSDNAKEFCGEKFRKFVIEKNIVHKKVSVESHQSNGRVERMIRTLREGLCKIKTGNTTEKLENICKVYNGTYHSAIKCSPIEAWRDISGIASLENTVEGNYFMRFKSHAREKFKKGDRILIAKRENIKKAIKENKGKYLIKGVVIEKCGGDSYIIRDQYGKLKKKRHYDLKKN